LFPGRVGEKRRKAGYREAMIVQYDKEKEVKAKGIQIQGHQKEGSGNHASLQKNAVHEIMRHLGLGE